MRHEPEIAMYAALSFEGQIAKFAGKGKAKLESENDESEASLLNDGRVFDARKEFI